MFGGPRGPRKRRACVCRRRQCLRASGGAHCRVARESELWRALGTAEQTARRKGPTRFLPSRQNSVATTNANRRKRGIVSVCRLRRSQAGRATSFGNRGRVLRPAVGGCHCFVTAERGCGGNELGSLWPPPPITRDQRAVAASTIEVLRTDQWRAAAACAAEPGA